jgi:pimeloyl-ACP methyl ester carboxylesterase
MEAQITSNTFCTYTASPKDAMTTVFFISGNPGLIGYYHPFLSLLGKYLANSQDQSSTESSIQIYGCSLGGFEVDCENTPLPSKTSGNDFRDRRSKLYDLEDQIVFVHDKLNDLMNQNASSSKDASGSPAKRKVILMGHSVGAYIAMEVLRRHREANPESESESSNGYTVDFDIIGGIMLFPTVKDIAHSPSGQKLTVRVFLFHCIHEWIGLSRSEINIDINNPL